MNAEESIRKRKKKFCTLEMKLKIIRDYKKGMKIRDLNKKYKINICNINYWVKNENNFKMNKHLSKKTIHSGAFKKINIDEHEILSLIENMHKNKEKINTLILFDIVLSKNPICNDIKEHHIKSWIYRFIKKYQLKSRYFEPKKQINSNYFDEHSSIGEIETLEYNRLNNKPFYIEKILVFGKNTSN